MNALRLFLRYPWLAGLIGAIGFLAFGFLGWDFWLSYRAFTAAPTPLAFAAAVQDSAQERRWVTVDGARWHCEQTLTSAQTAYVPLTDPDGKRHVVAEYPVGGFACEAVENKAVTGLLRPADEDTLEGLTKAGLNVAGQPAGTPVLELCTSCSKESFAFQLRFCTIMAVLMLLFYPLWLAFARSRHGKRAAAVAEHRWEDLNASARPGGVKES